MFDVFVLICGNDDNDDIVKMKHHPLKIDLVHHLYHLFLKSDHV